ncbi:MAG TPA: hypothetical protein VG916_00315 [Gemmatimonadaceae bacterium]|nr:hypothetical protein [Gemmatimonadaceae bacterium]
MLLVLLIVVVGVGGMKALGHSNSSKLSTVAASLPAGDAAAVVADGGGGGSGPSVTEPGGGSGAGDTPPVTTTTTAAPAPQATSVSASLDAQATRHGNTWTVDTTAAVQNSLSDPVEGATVALLVRAYTHLSGGSWDWVEQTVQTTTDANGNATDELGPFQRTGSTGKVSTVELSIVSVTSPSGLPLDQLPPAQTVYSP